MTTVPCRLGGLNAGPPRIFRSRSRTDARLAAPMSVTFDLVEGLGGERRRLDGDGLGRRRPLAGDVGAGHGPLLDVEERLARHPVEQEDIARLRHLGHGVDLLAVARDGDEVRIDRQVVVPEVVAQRLEVPDAARRSGRPARWCSWRTGCRRAGRRRRSRTRPTRARRRPGRVRRRRSARPRRSPPPRSFHESPSHVSSPNSPGRGTVRNRQSLRPCGRRTPGRRPARRCPAPRRTRRRG